MRATFLRDATCMAAALTMIAGAKPAHANAEFSLMAGAPVGFDELQGPRELLVDIYYGGRALGQTRAVVTQDRLKFRNPDDVARLLEDFAEPLTIRDALSAELPINADHTCSLMKTTQCGTLEVQRLGIIYQEDQLRVDVFLGPDLAKQALSRPVEYLQPSASGVSLVNSLGASIAGSFENAPDYNFQSRTYLGWGRERVRANTSYSSDLGLLVDDLVFEADRPDKRYAAGLFWAPGTALIGRRRILGVGVASQLDTRIGHEQLKADPINVFLQQPGQVDILVDGRLAWTQQVEAGNQLIDTSGLPEGSYPIAIRIREPGRSPREEVRFFTKDGGIVPLGETFFHGYAGFLAPAKASRAFNVEQEFYYQAGVSRRLGLRTAFDIGILGTTEKAVLDIGITHFSRFARVKAGALASSDGGKGGLLQLSSTTAGAASFSLDVRKVWGAARGPIIPGSSAGFGFSNNLGQPALSAGSDIFQINAAVGYQLKRVNFRLYANYFDSGDARADYSVGPSLDWLAVQRPTFQLRLEADAQKGRHSSAFYVGMRFLTVSGQVSLGGSSGIRSQQSDGSDKQTALVGNAEAEASGMTSGGARYAVGAAIDRGIDATAARTSASLYTDLGSVRADVLHAFGRSTNYSLNAQTGLIGGKSIKVGGRSVQESAIVLAVTGEPDAGSYEILINEQSSGRAAAGSSTTIFLAPYKQYDVRLRPTAGSATHFDAGSKAVTLYPGNVQHLQWAATKTFTAFGRLVDGAGSVVPRAFVQGRYGVGHTDDQGYFQLETAQGDLVEATISGGNSCALNFSATPSSDGYAAVGEVKCR